MYFEYINGNIYSLGNKIVKIIDFGESFDVKQTNNTKKYQTCKIRRSLSKDLVDTLDRCYTGINRKYYGKLKKTQKIGKILYNIIKSPKKKSGDEDINFLINIMKIFKLKIPELDSYIKQIEMLSKKISLSPYFIKDSEQFNSYNLNNKKVLGDIYNILINLKNI